jgi:hypothetical protein
MSDLRFSQRWLWRLSSSGTWRCVDLALTDASEGRIASTSEQKNPRAGNGVTRWLQIEPQSEITSYIITLPIRAYICLFPTEAQSAATCWCWVPARGFFYSEDGGDTFTRKVGWRKIYTTPRPRRWHTFFKLSSKGIKLLGIAHFWDFFYHLVL